MSLPVEPQGRRTAGVVIALFSFWLGGIASGQKFDRRGLSSHPTSTTAKVPVEAD